MNKRTAKKVVRNQIIRCRSRIDGPEDIITSGKTDYAEQQYQKALLKLLRRMNRETAKPTNGSILRCAGIYREMNRARLVLHIARAAA